MLMFNNMLLAVNIVLSYLVWILLLGVLVNKIKNPLLFVILVLLIYMIPVGYHIIKSNAIELITGPLASLIILIVYVIKRSNVILVLIPLPIIVITIYYLMVYTG